MPTADVTSYQKGVHHARTNVYNAFISNTKISNHDIKVFNTALAHSFYSEKQLLSIEGS
jgi:hypothetical protein